MAIEQTMAQLAHSQATQSMPSLADSIQGFQLIDSSEDDNSAIGVLVALIGDTCIYIPAIYKHGHIYNMDIMYVPEMSQWLPTQDNWVTYLKSKKPELLSILRLRENGDQSNKPGAVDLNIPFRQLVKAASIEETGRQRIARLGLPAILKEAGETIVAELDKDTSKVDIPSSMELLHKCAAESAAKFLNSIVENTALSNSFVQFYSDKDLMDIADSLSKLTEGKLTGNPLPEKNGSVRILTAASSEAKDLSEEDKKEILLKGAVIVDDRGLTPSKVFKLKNTGDWQTVNHTGIYELLKEDGNTLTAFVYAPNSSIGNRYDKKVLVVPLDDRKERVALTCEHPVGQAYPMDLLPDNVGRSITSYLSNTDSDTYESEFLLGTPGGSAIPCRVFKPMIVRNSDGSVTITGSELEVAEKSCNDFRSISSIEILPAKAKLRLVNKILYVPEGSVAIPINYWDGKKLNLATNADVCNSLKRRENMLGVKVVNAHHMFTISDDRNNVTEPLGKQAAAVTLVRNYAIPVDVANKIMDEASEKSVSQNRYLVKMASDTNYTLTFSEKPEDPIDEQMIDLNQKLPEDAATAIVEAANTGVKEIMDVTVLKTLARDTSSVRQIQELIPRLFSALDAVARILFMIRAGDSMSVAYGATRADDMEDQFSQLVDSLGDAIICLQRGRIDSIHDLLEGPLASTLG